MASVRINFTEQRQQQDQWCWAAVTASVADFYGKAVAQCSIVNAQLARTTCCEDGGSCDESGYLDRALDSVGAFADMSGPVEISAIITEIAAARPLAARYAWASGEAHVFAITAADDGSGVVHTEDPILGPGEYTIAELSSSYDQTPGTWTTTYFTQRIPAVLIARAHLVVPFIARPTQRRLGVRDSKRAMHLPIYELGTNDLRAGASLRDAKRSEYEEVLDGGIAVRVPLDSRLLKTADKEDHHDYRTALAMLGLESPESGTVRVLRIPGLYVSALWAVTDAGGTVTPVAPVPRFLEARPYEEDEFEAVVRKRAQKIAEHRRDSDDRAAP